MSTWALDLDGVIWTGTQPIPGADQAIADLRAAGHTVVFVTNNSFATIGEQEAKLASFGVDATDSVINSAQAGASLVEPGERVYVLGGPGVVEALEIRGAEVVNSPGRSLDGAEHPPEEIDAVLVGLDWDLSYDRLRQASQAVMAGARLIATNADPTYPTERGLFPGGGSLVAAVAVASGVDAVVAGKPHQALADLVRQRFGADGVMVGDRPDTDGLFAAELGYRFGLVFSGVTRPEDLPVHPTPDLTGADLASIVASELG